MKISLSYQRKLFDIEAVGPAANANVKRRSGAFVDNMKLSVHRWFRYSAGFSAEWVRHVINQHNNLNSPSFTVLDPFVGIGTTLLASDAENVQSLGFETHPFIYRIARAKIRGIHVNTSVLSDTFKRFAGLLPDVNNRVLEDRPGLLTKCYTQETLSQLVTMRDIFLAEFDKKTPETELLWLALTTILRPCSGAGTAQWQYVLPNKRKQKVIDPAVAFQTQAVEMLRDIEYAQRNNWSNTSRIFKTDARAPDPDIVPQLADVVITSPPYPNNYDYADATRLEMTFWGEINGWGDLQDAVRQYLIRSCSQHAAAEKLELEDVLSEPVIDPIKEELAHACHELSQVRLTKGGRKNYHTMAAAYFRDLGLVFSSLRKLCKDGATLCFVIGDSAPYGIYLNVDKWLAELALAAGFNGYSFEKIRDRNIKWKNRKHRVPLKEGRLWIEG